MSYELKLELPGLPRLNAADNRHWRVRHREKKRWMRDVQRACIGQRPDMPLERADVTMVRHSSGKSPDVDNLASSAKFLLDGLVQAAVLRDDSPKVIRNFRVGHEPAPRGKGFVTLVVHEVSDA